MSEPLPQAQTEQDVRDHEGRLAVEAQMGPALAATFELHGASVITDPETGTQQLHLRLPEKYRGGIQRLDLSRSTDPDTRVTTTTMVYSNGGRSYGAGVEALIFTEGGNQEPHLTPGLRDPKTGQITLRVQETPDSVYFKDWMIASDGRKWLRNLDPATGATPEAPKKQRNWAIGRRILGLMGLGR